MLHKIGGLRLVVFQKLHSIYFIIPLFQANSIAYLKDLKYTLGSLLDKISSNPSV